MATDDVTVEGDKRPNDAAVPAAAATATTTKKRKGLISRIWNGIFRIHGDDFEKRLQHISKEEAAVLARMKKRSQTWRRMLRNLILFSVTFEVIAVAYAVMTTRSPDVDWKVRALRVLPMFLLPALSFGSYSALAKITKMCERKDQRTLERLRAERQAKIDELKERTNYYTTQQLIQRYDPDPAAKAAAATVLASKLGADSGLKVYLGDDSQLNASVGKSNDVELTQSSGLRRRKEPHGRSSNEVSSKIHHHSEGEILREGSESPGKMSEHNQVAVDHFDPRGSPAQDGGWIARIAALLVGEDPTQSYALICGNCHMHNGLARKEDFPYITYYCPHCRALNRPKKSDGSSTEPVSPRVGPGTGSNTSSSPKEAVTTGGTSPAAESEIVATDDAAAQ